MEHFLVQHSRQAPQALDSNPERLAPSFDSAMLNMTSVINVTPHSVGITGGRLRRLPVSSICLGQSGLPFLNLPHHSRLAAPIRSASPPARPDAFRRLRPLQPHSSRTQATDHTLLDSNQPTPGEAGEQSGMLPPNPCRSPNTASKNHHFGTGANLST